MQFLPWKSEFDYYKQQVPKSDQLPYEKFFKQRVTYLLKPVNGDPEVWVNEYEIDFQK